MSILGTVQLTLTHIMGFPSKINALGIPAYRTVRFPLHTLGEEIPDVRRKDEDNNYTKRM
jgi:hypothetical protein